MARRIEISEGELTLAEKLLDALYDANALSGMYAVQNGGAYGEIRKALLRTLEIATRNRAAARRLYESAINNGENIAYQIKLNNEG